ncbi:MAG: RNA polymerase sigma factor [Bacteroidales bacterium]|jgi:RNA polymerase sigma-70 factor (ECF subfamily)|nr:RNA polymerase sigma factor [Bacteroidales bacterium]
MKQIRGRKKEKAKDNQRENLLYKQYAPYLYGVALRYTKSEADAQDVLQESFLIIFETMEQYDKRGTIQSWMARIVINQALKLNRKQLKVKYENYDDYEEIIADESIVQSDMYTHEVLLELIRDLPKGYQMVFNMCEIEGYSHDEVAKILDCSPTTCRSQLSKAKKMLRKKVNEFNESEKLN